MERLNKTTSFLPFNYYLIIPIVLKYDFPFHSLIFYLFHINSTDFRQNNIKKRLGHIANLIKNQ